jgi:ribonuclease J
VITNGQVATVTPDALTIGEERVPQGKVFIDGEAEEVPDVVVRDRQHLAEDGVVILDSNARLIRDPEIITRGLLHVDESQDLLADVRQQVVGIINEGAAEELRESDLLQEKLRAALKRYFRKEMGRRPMILPVVWEM